MTKEQLGRLTDAERALAEGLITKVGLQELAYVYGIGAKKYAPNGWLENPMPVEEMWGRILSHSARRIRGEIYDRDDFQMHMASVAWAALGICHYDKEHMIYHQTEPAVLKP